MTRTTPPSSASRRTLSLKREANSASTVAERLHKVLAQAGLGSRRALEERIAQGQVKVNGEVANLGSSVKSGDRIELDGKTFVTTVQSETPRVIVYNKPEGEVTTREDPEGRPTVFDRLPQIKGARWINVGRLDINTTGLLLLTTDGDLANALMHPSREVEREYVCRVRAPEGQDDISDELAQQLVRGVQLDDGPASFEVVERIGGTDSHDWFRVVVKEGRNREVRRLWESQGCQVSRLKRVRYGNVALPRLLKRGHFEELSPDAVSALRSELNLDNAEATLTLQPVIGQRRAKPAEYRPAPREQRAWTGGYNSADEARELRAFDNIRDDRPGKPRYGKPGGGRPAPPGRKGGGRQIPDDIGNRLTAPGGITGPRKNKRGKGTAPGFENPTEHRTWYVPEGVTTTSRIAPPRQVGRPGPLGDRPAGARGKPGARPGGKPGGKPGSGPRPGGAGPRGPQGGKGGHGNAGNRPGRGAPRSNKPRG
ncbi:pseudouridine synthase [Xanthomonadaceae bacterium JHOS43]|nr:pseudouridine synthase [Xanthomonadaceae bacterium JHOS43]MCX7563720.1 pseudouridine synthase [Xanthomonadaceae bacterium XH05]